MIIPAHSRNVYDAAVRACGVRVIAVAEGRLPQLADAVVATADPEPVQRVLAATLARLTSGPTSTWSSYGSLTAARSPSFSSCALKPAAWMWTT